LLVFIRGTAHGGMVALWPRWCSSARRACSPTCCSCARSGAALRPRPRLDAGRVRADPRPRLVCAAARGPGRHMGGPDRVQLPCGVSGPPVPLAGPREPGRSARWLAVASAAFGAPSRPPTMLPAAAVLPAPLQGRAGPQEPVGLGRGSPVRVRPAGRPLQLRFVSATRSSSGSATNSQTSTWPGSMSSARTSSGQTSGSTSCSRAVVGGVPFAHEPDAPFCGRTCRWTMGASSTSRSAAERPGPLGGVRASALGCAGRMARGVAAALSRRLGVAGLARRPPVLLRVLLALPV